jgi:sugar-specific transcriptional regulator TrmB
MREMKLHNRQLRILYRLGLTPLQAKTYLTLIGTGKEKIQAISRIADMDRANTYQIVNQLQKMGLVEKILGRPNFYQAMSLQEGLSILLERKKEQCYKIQQETQKLLTASLANQRTLEEKESEFKVIKRGKRTAEKDIIEHVKRSQKSIDYLLNIKSFQYGMFALSKYYLECAKRGVKHRVIVEETNLAAIKENAEPFLKAPNFQIKYFLNSSTMEFVIVDKEDLHIPLLKNRGPGGKPELTLGHPAIIEVFEKYFEMLWNQAQELET